MQKSGRGNPRLKERVEALGRELNRMDAEIRTISHAAEHPDRETAMRRLRKLNADQERFREIQAARAAAESNRTDRGPVTAAPLGEPAGGVDSAEGSTRNTADPRFASYFVTGSLHSIKPLRQEQRVQRNRALIMLALAVVVVYGVISLIF